MISKITLPMRQAMEFIWLNHPVARHNNAYLIPIPEGAEYHFEFIERELFPYWITVEAEINKLTKP